MKLLSVLVLLQLDEGVIHLSMEEIKRAYPDVRSLVGNSVYVKASVLTKSGKPHVRTFAKVALSAP